MKEITQRELRNDSGAIMRGLDAGESFLVTRNGVAVGELVPIRRARFVRTDLLMDLMFDAPRMRPPVRERVPRGVLDTSVVIGLEIIDPVLLPVEAAVAAITLAELAAGPHCTKDAAERARRQDRLQRVERAFDALPFEDAAARAYGRLYALETARGRKARGARMADLSIAATAAAAGMPVFTRNLSAFARLDDFVHVIAIK